MNFGSKKIETMTNICTRAYARPCPCKEFEEENLDLQAGGPSMTNDDYVKLAFTENLRGETIRGPLPDPEDCAGCPLAIDGKPDGPVRGIGPQHPKFIVIAEGPGVNEKRQGLPLIGKSGQILGKALTSSNVKREEVWLGNTTLCLPPRESKEDVVKQATAHCRKRLIKEIDALGPDPPILAVGKHAASALIQKDFKITELAGTFHTISLEDIPFTKDVIPTIHPAAMLRSNDNSGAHTSDLLFWFLQYDVAKVNGLAAGRAEPFKDDVDFETRDAAIAHQLVVDILRESLAEGWLACDLETRGITNAECSKCPNCYGHSALEATFAQITAIGLATEARGISVAWEILKPETKFLLATAFANKDRRWVFHNRGYDEVVLECNGFPIAGRIDCTLYMHHNVFPGLAHKLQRVGSQFMLVRPWKAEFRHGEGSLEELLRYNARDTLVTARLKKPLEALLVKRDATATYEMDMRKCAAAKDMQITGVPIDMERNQVFREYFEPKVAKARAALMARIQDPTFKENFKQLITLEQAKVTRKADADQFGLRQAKRLSELEKKWAKLETEGEDLFNLNSTPQLVAYLKACGVNLTVLTKKGKLSTKKDVLEQLISHPAVAELLEFRANQTLLNTFVLPIPYKIDLTGRIHPIWSPNKISGRWGSSPNWQNTTKGKTMHKKYEAWLAAFRLWQKGEGPDPDIPNLRWQCVAPAGYTLVGSDFKQIDARVIALLANDAWLCDAFNTGVDIHSFFAAEIFPEFLTLDVNDPSQAKRKKDLRDITKRAEYGYFYGAAIVTVWKSIVKEGYNVPISTINKLFKTFEQKMPTVIRYYMNLLRTTVESSRVSSFLLNRSQYFPLGDAASDPTVIKNFVCQAGAADVADTGIIAVHEILKDRNLGKTILQGHDAGTWLVKEEDAPEVKKIILEHMAQVHTLKGVTMKFDVEVDIGRSWAET